MVHLKESKSEQYSVPLKASVQLSCVGIIIKRIKLNINMYYKGTFQ